MIANCNLTLGDFEATKRKLAAENAHLLRIVGDLDTNFNMLMKVKSSLAGQLEEVKSLADNEARERSLLLGKYRNLEHEVDGAKEALDEESSSRDNVLRQVNKAEGDAALWSAKYETEAVAKAEELEMTKMKLVARLTEAEGTIQNLNAKLAQVEKSKFKLASQLEETAQALDQAQVLNSAMERNPSSSLLVRWMRLPRPLIRPRFLTLPWRGRPSSSTRLLVSGSRRLIL